ncbi:MAG: STAS domain-containing protein [Gemmatimonadaceae bacterium]|nr:STAS domain-containing protein [Gemmatimonadaceae bacterium]NUQ91494.1 STAS domain-containing protein [Gemmatimonadaceae bacterium]NUR33939.1 STAS domain-containing protein [Gemmatimonadaceae bacterium]NUS98348.1 STAS domain-containing protein [Gemmatimonadaceae bacterium]
MDIRIEQRDDTTVVGITGQLLLENRQELKDRVLEEVQHGRRRFLIDFQQTSYIDSSGLGALVSAAKRIREAGGEIFIANLNPDLRTLFSLTRLDLLLPDVYDDGGDASTRVPAVPRPAQPSGKGSAEMPRPSDEARP